MSDRFTIAAAQYPIGRPADWAAYEENLSQWVVDAAGMGARLLVFPEYGGVELASTAGPAAESDLAAIIDTATALRPRVDDLHARLAAAHGCFILAGSLPVRQAHGPVNLARLFGPAGGRGEQGKLIMTRFEREQWGIVPAPGLCLFETPLARIGVAICYDAEFPLVARALAEAGAELLLVPSCTDAPAGYHRVRVAAQARALENQFYVVQSPTVGAAPWSPAVDENHGAAGIFGPPDTGFPDDGVIALGKTNEPGWICAEIDPAAVARVRAEGQVLNHAHWPEQPGSHPAAAVTIVRLA